MCVSVCVCVSECEERLNACMTNENSITLVKWVDPHIPERNLDIWHQLIGLLVMREVYSLQITFKTV